MQDNYTQEILARVRVDVAVHANTVQHLTERIEGLETKLGRVIAMAQRIWYAVLTAGLLAANVDPKSSAHFLSLLVDGVLK